MQNRKGQNQRLKFAIFGNSHQKARLPYIKLLLKQLKEHDCAIAIEKEFLSFLERELGEDVKADEEINNAKFEANYAISVGGDGTFLSTAAWIRDKNIPVIGINTGHLGFMADARASDAGKIIDGISQGQFMIEKRSLLRLCVEGGGLNVYPVALNEVAILKHEDSSMISINTSIDDHFLATYRADGLLVSTPTGSTGYPLSVGGPIIRPTTHAVCLTPVAAHSLNVRPIVLDDKITIRMTVRSRNHKFLVSVDGRSQSLKEDAELCIRKAPYYLNVLKMNKTNYFDTLRQKLHWGVDPTDADSAV